ncbi:MAG: amidohydrolase family protein [Alphaproteobacteria bacterium]|nr:amidohydrolase family protein [Alphaproteobacteria bacterium]
MATTVLRGGRVLDVAADRADPVDIAIVCGSIAEIGAPGTIEPPGAAVVDASDRLLVPGLVNAHTHAHGGLGRGAVGDKVPLELFLNAAGAINGQRTIEDKYLSAALSAAEMIRRGCTAGFDLFVEFPAPSAEGVRAVAQAYAEIGMRAVVAPMLADRTLYQALPGLLDAIPEPQRGYLAGIAMAPFETSLANIRPLFADWPFDRDYVRPAIAPTIPLHCSDEFIVACARMAREFDIPFQTHLAETKVQAVLSRAKYGKSMTAHLDALGVLGSKFSGAHGIWIDRLDMDLIAQRGGRIAHNPGSNLRLGSGIAAMREMIDAGIEVGIGTDGSNTGDGQNIFEAARLAAYLSRMQGPEYGRWITAREAFEAATAGSARLLGFDKLGRIAPGFAADIVFLRLDQPQYVPLRSPTVQMVFGESGSAVDKVMIGGRMVFADGKLLTLDEAKLRREAEAAAARLDAANERIRQTGASVHDFVGAFCVAHGRAGCHIRRRLDCLPA